MAELETVSIRRERGRFVRGLSYSPETQIVKGQRFSPRTEFKPGQVARNRLPVGFETIRLRNGGPRAFVKTAEPNVWRERAHLVWEARHGPIPKGYVVHHGDRNTLNDDIGNLVALTRSQHAAEHAEDVRAAGFGSELSRFRAVEARRRS